jgi:hypothetical protein
MIVQELHVLHSRRAPERPFDFITVVFTKSPADLKNDLADRLSF